MFIYTGGAVFSSHIALCDGAFQKFKNKAAAAVVLLDSDFSLRDGVADRVVVNSALGAEAYAIRAACVLGSIRRCRELVVCSDSKFVIELSSSDLEPPWEITSVIADIRTAHWVVQASVSGALSEDWVSNVHPILQSLINEIG